MNIITDNLSKSARKKYFRYGNIPISFRSSVTEKVKTTRKEIRRVFGLNIQSISQQHLWEKLELYGNYKKITHNNTNKQKER
jgi:hypothetical protein